MPSYQFKIQIKDLKNPTVWRRIVVPSEITFHRFHEVIQIAVGWGDAHLYQFSPGGWGSKPLIQQKDSEVKDAVDSKKIRLSAIFTEPKQQFIYIYDFGDNWEHQITLEKISEEIVIYPVCLDGGGACPPDDCGGIPGYAHLLEVVSNPENEEYEEMMDWLGLEYDMEWDVNWFDLEITNAELREI